MDVVDELYLPLAQVELERGMDPDTIRELLDRAISRATKDWRVQNYRWSRVWACPVCGSDKSVPGSGCGHRAAPVAPSVYAMRQREREAKRSRSTP